MSETTGKKKQGFLSVKKKKETESLALLYAGQ